jgi:7-cyano-7-deazaguanine synthase in queuosine biosynthesis
MQLIINFIVLILSISYQYHHKALYLNILVNMQTKYRYRDINANAIQKAFSIKHNKAAKLHTPSYSTCLVCCLSE